MTIHDDFVERFKGRTRKTVLIGDPWTRQLRWGRWLAETSKKSVLSEINLAKQEGARLALGGQTPEGFDREPMWNLRCSLA